MNNRAIVEKDRATVSERIGAVVSGTPHRVGSGFTANHFSEDMFAGRMDPLLTVDHFVMTEPTFEPHLHAGISAVTAMFEDSDGAFLNRDTLGHTVGLKAGDLYWLAAASGAVHEEKPEEGARAHALQVFVDLPERLKKEPARALHVEAEDVPILEGAGYRVRVVLGRSGATVGAQGTPEEMTMLDGVLQEGGHFSHPVPNNRQAWIYAVSGEVVLSVEGEMRLLTHGTATTVAAGSQTEIIFQADAPAHFVLIAAKPIHEQFVKHGPLFMSSADDVQETLAGYAVGRFGNIPS